jgi:hypothetical protein
VRAILAPELTAYKEVVRVAINNNFNCTPEEYRQLDGFVMANPTSFFFVNCNVKTPALLTLNDHPYKAVITLNPDIVVRENEVSKFYSLKRERVAFVRVKYIPDSQPVVELIQELSEARYPVVITKQRFNSKVSLSRYANLRDYQFQGNKAHLIGKALSEVQALADTTPDVYICDRRGLGCQGCGLCSKLTLGQDLKITSLNMSSSGECKFNCVDCYAKTLQNFLRKKKIPTRVMIYDVIHQNEKQAGRTEHIKKARAALAA